MVDGIGHTGRSMFSIDRFGIGRVKQRADRIKKRVHISDLVIGLRPGNNTATIILTAGSGKRHDIDNGKSILCFYLIRNQVPRVTFISGGCGNRLAAVED